MPAAYPTAIKTFTTKHAGDVVQPAFVNDLQDEVHAVSSALLGGKERLNIGPSTLTALSVPGGSTLASLQVSSNCTIAGTLTVQTIVSTSLSQRSKTSYVWAYTDNAESGSSRVNLPANSTNSTLSMALNLEFEDALSEYDSTTFIFTPKSSGFYRVEVGYTPAAPSLGVAWLQVRVNDTVYTEVGTPMNPGTAHGPNFATIVRCASSGAAGAIRCSLSAQSSSVLSSNAYKNWLRITKVW